MMTALIEPYLTAADLAFRSEVRTFVASRLPPSLAAKTRAQSHLSREDVTAWHRILHVKGWSAPCWPREFGGPGWTPVQRYLFEDECAAADAPPLSPFGVSMVGPVIYTFGTAAQKARYLPPILGMQEHWCQGYSEPGSGSDLASVSTRARLDGDVYIVNGSKIWTTDAHKADMIFCLVRTDLAAKSHAGISFLLIDMKSSGVTVRPIVSIDGGHSLNEVFFEEVRVPRENLLGEENKGWTYAKFLLGHERQMLADISRTKRRLSILHAIVAADEALRVDPVFAHRLAAAEVELMALELTNLRLLLRAGDGAGADPVMAASMLKLRGSEVLQLVGELTVQALGYGALPYEQQTDGSHQSPVGEAAAAGRVEDYLYRRAATIYGGSSETQRNILARILLG